MIFERSLILIIIFIVYKNVVFVAERNTAKRRFYLDRDRQFWFDSHPSGVVASSERPLYYNYLCLVISNKQQLGGKKSTN